MVESNANVLMPTRIMSLFLLRWQAEDRVDELTKDLLQTRHQLQATEEEKRGKEEEAAMVRAKIFMCLMIS